MHNLPSSASRAAALALLTVCRCDELPPIRGMRDVKPSDTSASEFEVCSHRTATSCVLRRPHGSLSALASCRREVWMLESIEEQWIAPCRAYVGEQLIGLCMFGPALLMGLCIVLPVLFLSMREQSAAAQARD